MSISNGSCFDGVDSSNWYKTTAIGFSLVVNNALLPFFFGIIWFERFGSDKLRTLFNKLVSSLCWNSLVFHGLLQNAFTIRTAFGPMPNWLCFLLSWIRKSQTVCSILLVTSMTAVRYLFIFRLKNPGAFNDEFWFAFVSIWVVAFASLFQLIRMLVPGNHLFDLNYCSGDDPSKNLCLPAFARGYVDLGALALHACFYARVFFFKLKTAKSFGPESRASFLKRQILAELESHTLTSLAINFSIVGLLGVNVILNSRLRLETCQDYQTFPNYLSIYFSNLIFPTSFGVWVIIFYYHRNQAMRMFLQRELRNSDMLNTLNI